MLLHHYCVLKLFNYMFDKCIYPESSSNGIIVPVPKKGDRRDVNNYRAIILTSIFLNIFSHILDNRLQPYVETQTHLIDFQFGFRENKSTIDCIYILKVSKGAKIRNRYNQVPHLTQDTNGKVTNSQQTPQTRAKRSALSQQVTTKHI